MKAVNRKWIDKIPSVFNFHASHLSIAEVGAAMELAIYYGKHGTLPESDKELAEIIGISVQEFRALAGDRSREGGLMRTVKETVIPLIYGEEIS
jgi:hypothetical protein